MAVLTLALDEAWTAVDTAAFDRYETSRDGHHSTKDVDSWYMLSASNGLPPNEWRDQEPPLHPYPSSRRHLGGEGHLMSKDIQVALATALVESNLVMYANSKGPASLQLPHDAVGSNGMSVGLFRQQNFPERGSLQCRKTPACSAGVFYDHLVNPTKWAGGLRQHEQLERRWRWTVPGRRW